MPSTSALAAFSWSAATAYSALATLRRGSKTPRVVRLVTTETFLVNGVTIQVAPNDTLSPLAGFLLEAVCLGLLLFSCIIATLNVASLFTDAVDSRFVLIPRLTYWSWCCCAGLFYICGHGIVHNVRTIWNDGVVADKHSPYHALFWRRAMQRACLKGTIIFALYLVVAQPIHAIAVTLLLYGYLAEGRFQMLHVHACAVGAWMALRLVEP